MEEHEHESSNEMTIREALSKIDRAKLEKIAAFAVNVLGWYGDPDTYFALSVVPDPPCGDFIHDRSIVDEDERPRFGRRARLADMIIRRELCALLGIEWTQIEKTAVEKIGVESEFRMCEMCEKSWTEAKEDFKRRIEQLFSRMETIPQVVVEPEADRLMCEAGEEAAKRADEDAERSADAYKYTRESE